jgi:thiopeptide-type bacteriocin biosynthesis protein
LLDRTKDAKSEFADGIAALNRRSERMQPVAAVLREWESSRGMHWLESLASSYIHMHANRVLRSAHRSQELVMYDFLARMYKSQRARERS